MRLLLDVAERVGGDFGGLLVFGCAWQCPRLTAGALLHAANGVDLPADDVAGDWRLVADAELGELAFRPVAPARAFDVAVVVFFVADVLLARLGIPIDGFAPPGRVLVEG